MLYWYATMTLAAMSRVNDILQKETLSLSYFVILQFHRNMREVY